MDFIRVNKNYIEVGATTSLIEFENEIKKYYPDFYSVLKRYGSVQIRSVGTIGGNIATASPNFIWQVGIPLLNESSSIEGRSSWISE